MLCAWTRIFHFMNYTPSSYALKSSVQHAKNLNCNSLDVCEILLGMINRYLIPLDGCSMKQAETGMPLKK